MKIGLVTFHFANNYGALLQTYATINFIKKYTKDVYIINIRKKTRSKIITYLYDKFLNSKFDIFKRTYFTDKFISIKDLQFNFFLDKVIVGSDQVWRSKFTGSCKYNYYLDFVPDDIYKYSYASSYGIGFIDDLELNKEKVIYLLSRFRSVSTREIAGVNILKNEFDCISKRVPDPVYLISRDELIKNFKLKKKKSDTQSIFILDNDNNTKLKSYFIKSNIKYNDLNGKKFLKYFLLRNSVDMWLQNIYSSKLVITDSFHCSVFCLKFNVPFIRIENLSRGNNRLEELSSRYKLNNSYSSIDEFINAYHNFKDSLYYNREFIQKTNLEEEQFAQSYLQNIINEKC